MKGQGGISVIMELLCRQETEQHAWWWWQIHDAPDVLKLHRTKCTHRHKDNTSRAGEI